MLHEKNQAYLPNKWGNEVFLEFQNNFVHRLRAQEMYKQIYLGKTDLLVDFLSSISTNKVASKL